LTVGDGEVVNHRRFLLLASSFSIDIHKFPEVPCDSQIAILHPETLLAPEAVPSDTTTTGSVRVQGSTAVPEPSSLLLLAIGALAGLILKKLCGAWL
jgi:hypothetical protein